MSVVNEIRRNLIERHPDAFDIDIITFNDAKGVYWARVIFFNDYDVLYLVSEYSNEYLDFFKFEFSQMRDSLKQELDKDV